MNAWVGAFAVCLFSMPSPFSWVEGGGRERGGRGEGGREGGGGGRGREEGGRESKTAAAELTVFIERDVAQTMFILDFCIPVTLGFYLSIN
jgi:hypothetical protein